MADPNGSQAETVLHDVVLTGCRPEPLASYLKALGILRLVAEQKDAAAQGFWQGQAFALRSKLDASALLDFFMDEWRPTPVVSPWNGGSGFWPSTSDEALRSIETSHDPRFLEYVSTIGLVRTAIRVLGLTEAPEKGEPKTRLLTYLRANSTDLALRWLDAVAVLTDEDPVYPALLGTGGNDGRQDFSNNFMQRVMSSLGDRPAANSALFGDPCRNTSKGSMGQFSPTSLDRSNGWDFILAIEGAMVLSGAATRRLESRSGSTISFPFHVRAAATPGAAEGEDGHGEAWLPLWPSASTYWSVAKVFAEGRAKTGSGDAITGLDFARSVSSLGVDRGLSEFTRFSFKPRNGKNYFASPLGRFPTREVPSVRLLDELDGWYGRFRGRASGRGVPERVAVARRRLETAMFEVAAAGAVGPLLLALGDVELALARSLAFAAKEIRDPVPRLGPRWRQAVGDGTIEQRLAAALASRPGIRSRLLPLDKTGRRFGSGNESEVVFTERPLVDNLHALLLREEVETAQGDRASRRTAMATEGRTPLCSLSDVAAFIAAETNDLLIERWLRGLVLIESGNLRATPAAGRVPPALFAILFAVHGRRVRDDVLPRTANVLARACAGDAVGASSAAARRLRACGSPLPFASLFEPPIRTRRIAAALAFPLTENQRRTLEGMVLPAIDLSIPDGAPHSPDEEHP